MSLEGKKILFIDTVHPLLQQRLEEQGAICMDGKALNREQILAYVADFQGIVIRSRTKIDQEFLEKAIQLEFIARSGSGLENIDLSIARQKGIQVFNSPEGNADAVAEHCIGMLLALFNNLNNAHNDVVEGLWQREKNRGIELAGKTVGILGYGTMGKALAKRLGMFHVELLAFDTNSQQYDEHARPVSLQELKQRSDVISLHVDYKKNNYHLIDADFISGCEKEFYLINSSRGNVVNTRHLLTAIEQGSIQGACLDVIEMESSSFDLTNQDLELIRQLDRTGKVLFTPHVAGWTNESYRKLSSVLADKILEHYYP